MPIDDELDGVEEMIAEAKKAVPPSPKATPGPAPRKGKAGAKPVPGSDAHKPITKQVYVTAPQAEFLRTCDTDKREEMLEVCFSGGVGSGKSSALVLMLLKYVMRPNTVVILAHLHLSVLKKTTLPLLIKGTVSPKGEFIPPLLPPECIAGYNKTEGIIYLHNGSSIILIGIRDGEKIRSINASAAFVDELTLVDRSSYFSILQRCRVYCGMPNAVYSATNPDSRNHWVYEYYVKDTTPGYRWMVTADSRSNRDNLPASYVKSLEKLPDEERRRMLEGLWVNSGSQVFYAFDKETMVSDISTWNKGDYDDFILTNDLGGGAKWSGTLLIGRSEGVYTVLEEFSSLKSTHREVLQWMEKYRDLTELVAYDPANAVFRTDLENASFTPMKPAKDIEIGVSKLNSMFKEMRIRVSKACQKTIMQLGQAYRNPETNKWDKNAQEIDLLDALRYGILVFDDNQSYESKSGTGGVFVFSM